MEENGMKSLWYPLKPKEDLKGSCGKGKVWISFTLCCTRVLPRFDWLRPKKKTRLAISYYSPGRAKAGFGALKVNTDQELKGPVETHSAKASDDVAVLKVLQVENQKVSLAIFTNLD